MRPGRAGRWRVAHVTTLAGVVGLTAVVAFALAAQRAHTANEQRLVEERAREAAAVLDARVAAVEAPLTAAAHAVDGGSDRAAAMIGAVLGPTLEDGGRFASIVAWEGEPLQQVAALGQPPHASVAEVAAAALPAGVPGSSGAMAVLDLIEADPPRLAMVARAPGGAVVHVEQVLPPDRTSVIQPESAFADLHYALYLVEGGEIGPVLLASTPDLPLGSPSAVERVAFGDRELHLVISPMGQLGGSLLPVLPWLMVVLGLPLTIAAAVLLEVLNRRRRRAEELAAERSQLYDRQREVAATLQRSLLPPELPTCEGVDLAARYVAGTEDAEVGGDLYDVVVMPGGRLLAVIGDVMGRGVQAAAVMGAARQTIRALASAGMAPHEVLTELNRPGLVNWAGRFATVTCCELDVASGVIRVAVAGHVAPILTSTAGTAYMTTVGGLPVGVVPDVVYESTTVELAPGATILLVTDGLFERRDEPIDDGIERMLRSAQAAGPDAQRLVDSVLADLQDGPVHDDIAVLAIGWRGPVGSTRAGLADIARTA